MNRRAPLRLMGGRAERDRSIPDQRGFSLIEAIVATAIAIIAVLGLANTFGTGSALITRYEIGRAALGLAQRRMEALASLTPAALACGTADSTAFVYKGRPVGIERWSVVCPDDPYDNDPGGSDISGGPIDFKVVTVEVQWGERVGKNTVRLVRHLPAS